MTRPDNTRLPAPSEAMRDYLAEMYRLGHGKMWVSTTMLAERMGVSGAAAVAMVRRLQKRALVEHLPYRGARLTPAGAKVALLSIRRHRLVERFLVDVMQFGWHEVHAEAESLQRGVTQAIEDRMDALMGHPATCPHGDPIPSREGVMPELHDRPLTVIPAGGRGTISRVRTREADRLQYLAQIGLIPGAPFELVSRAPFNGPLRLRLGAAEQVIGVELAAALWVTTPADKKA